MFLVMTTVFSFAFYVIGYSIYTATCFRSIAIITHYVRFFVCYYYPKRWYCMICITWLVVLCRLNVQQL